MFVDQLSFEERIPPPSPPSDAPELFGELPSDACETSGLGNFPTPPPNAHEVPGPGKPPPPPPPARPDRRPGRPRERERELRKDIERGRRDRLNSALKNLATLLPLPQSDGKGNSRAGSKTSTVNMAVGYIKQLQQQITAANQRAEEAEMELALSSWTPRKCLV